MEGRYTYLLSLGSNLGNPIRNILIAHYYINKINCCKIVEQSLFYKSPAQGFKSENYFINQNILVQSTIKPDYLLSKLNEIEKRLGRVKTKSEYEDRLIDIDIILCDTSFSNKIVQIPHPRYTERRFVTIPMLDLRSCFFEESRNANKNSIDKSKIFKFL